MVLTPKKNQTNLAWQIQVRILSQPYFIYFSHPSRGQSTYTKSLFKIWMYTCQWTIAPTLNSIVVEGPCQAVPQSQIAISSFRFGCYLPYGLDNNCLVGFAVLNGFSPLPASQQKACSSPWCKRLPKCQTLWFLSSIFHLKPDGQPKEMRTLLWQWNSPVIFSFLLHLNLCWNVALKIFLALKELI